jgi:hypothetical protein
MDDNCPRCQQGQVDDTPCEVCLWHPEHEDHGHHVPDGHEPFEIGGGS